MKNRDKHQIFTGITGYNRKSRIHGCRATGTNRSQAAKISHENSIVLQELVEKTLEQIVVQKIPESIVFDATLLGRFSDATIREILHRLWIVQNWPLREMGFEQWSGLVAFFRNGKSSQSLHGGMAAFHDGERFVLTYRRDM